MGLRFKLFLPTLVLLVTVSSLMHFYWLPNYLASEIEQQFEQERAYIRLLGNTMIGDLLSNDLAQIHETLDRVLEHREYWHSIRLYKKDQNQIYPLVDKDVPEVESFELLQQPIRFYDENLANIVVRIDIKTSSAKKIQQIQYLEQLLLSILLAVSLTSFLFQDRWIRNPLKQLALIAKEITKGNYDTVLNYQSHDEVGNLVDSFNNMREQVSSREKKLRYYSNIQNTIRHVQDKFIRGISDEYVFYNLLEKIIELTGSEHGFIGEVLHDKNDKPYIKTFCATSMFIIGYVDDRATKEQGVNLEFHDPTSLACEVIETGNAVNKDSFTEANKHSVSIEVRNYLGLPLSTGGKLVGVLGLANRSDGYPSWLYDELQILLVTLSGLIVAYRREKALQESESRYRSVVDNAADGIITIDSRGKMIGCNASSEKIFGYSSAEMVGENIKMLMPEPYKSQHDGYLHRYLTTGEKHIIGSEREVMGQRKDGTTFPLDLAVSEMEINGVIMFMGIMRDISERVSAKQARLRYSKSLERLHEITSDSDLDFEHKINSLLKLGQEIFKLPLAIVSHIVDQRYIVEHVLGPEGAPAPGTEFALGETYCYHTLESRRPTGFNHVATSNINNHPCYLNFGLESYIGAPLTVRGQRYGTLNFSSPEVHAEPFSRIDFSLIQLFAEWIGSEISRHEAEVDLESAYKDVNIANAKLEKMSRTDALTGIANRRYFDEFIAMELNRAIRHKDPMTLIICDIDYFKKYNDCYGHLAGDSCLRQVTDSIKTNFARAGELVARYGGEEFAIILPGVKHEKAMELAEEMRINVMDLKLKHETSLISDHVTISVGVTTLVPDQNTIVSTLIEQADKALYEAKSCGRNNVQFYK